VRGLRASESRMGASVKRLMRGDGRAQLVRSCCAGRGIVWAARVRTCGDHRWSGSGIDAGDGGRATTTRERRQRRGDERSGTERGGLAACTEG
jgi:hypothetical protein